MTKEYLKKTSLAEENEIFHDGFYDRWISISVDKVWWQANIYSHEQNKNTPNYWCNFVT